MSSELRNSNSRGAGSAESDDESGRSNATGRAAMRFVFLLGGVSLFADMTYEGCRSVAGPFLAVLGASGTAVGLVAGAGELVGYGLRLISGYLTDRTGRYWAIAIFGYSVNLAAVPLLALTNRWELAAALLIVERFGKAIRAPARDAMLSHATAQVGHGRGFGIHEAMDQIGAVVGPLIVASVVYVRHDYRSGFAILAVPGLLAIGTLILSRSLYPNPRDLERKNLDLNTAGFPRVFWWYLVGIGLLAAGYADFPLIAYHLKQHGVTDDVWIPALYALAMGIDAIAALVVGYLFDRYGLRVLVGSAVLSSLFAPLVFLGGFASAICGVAIWGIGMGAQESIMRAAVAGMIAKDRRGSAYGVFNMGYGIAWFAGSATMGLLYDHSIGSLIAFSVIAQAASVPVLFAVHRARR